MDVLARFFSLVFMRSASRRALTSVLVWLVVWLVTSIGCSFDPNLGDGAIACGPSGSCPPGLSCAADGRCHRDPSSVTAADGGSDGDVTPGAPSNLIVTDISVVEGATGTTDAVFNVRLVPASSREVKVDYTTLDDTARAPSDYAKSAATLVFAPGETSKLVTVKVVANEDVQPARRFLFVLSNPTDAIISLGQAACTILDDDTFGLLVKDTSVMEGASGLTDATFDVLLTGASSAPVTVAYATVEGTALEGKDYVKTSGTLVFEPGARAKTVKVPVRGNTTNDPSRFFFLTLANASGAPILNGQAKGNIIDDDALPTLSINDVMVVEGNVGSSQMTFHVTLSAASAAPVTVDYATALGTASANDFSAASGTLTFAPGETDKSIVIAIEGDTRAEADETFTVTLSQATNAGLTKAVGTGTIKDDDADPAITIDDVTLPEGQAGTTKFSFPVKLSQPSGKTVSVSYVTENDMAIAGSDYDAASGVLTFAAGETMKTVDVDVTGDTVDEGVERFVVRLSAPVNATLDRDTGAGTILNDDSTLPSLTISDVTVAEGNAGTTAATFTITLSPAAAQNVTVNWATSDETAHAPGDYVSASGVVTFLAGETTKTATVSVNGDVVFEPDETFMVTLFGPQNANIVDAVGRAIITNDDAPPVITIASASVVEGNAGTTALSFPVSLSAASSQDVTVSYATADGTAKAYSDYAQSSGTITFAPGETTKSVTVSVTGDVVNEPDETMSVTLSSANGATLGTSTATGTITNDDAPPEIRITSTSQAEGNAGATTAFTFTVSLSAPASAPVSVTYATADGTALAASDYVATNGVLTFAPGETSKPLSVSVLGDATDEPNETFFVNLSAPTGAAVLATSQGQGTILNDDSLLPTLSVNDTTVVEGQSGTVSASFTVTLSAASLAPVTVAWATANGTATTADGDYDAASGLLTFLPGQVSKTIDVTVHGDAQYEADETFFVNLSTPTGATLFDGQGQATIQNDDPLPSLTIDNVSLTEGNVGNSFATFTVSLSAPSGQTVSVAYTTEDVTAVAGSDYVTESGVLTFNPGQTSKTISVRVTGDAVPEPDETFHVHLSNPTGATLAGDTGVGTILNDDSLPTLTIANVSLLEGNSGNRALTFTITLSAISGSSVSVQYATADGSAQAPSDYVSKSGTATIPAGQLTTTFSVQIKGDSVAEPDETFFVNLSNPSGATIAVGQATGTILNDD